MAFNLFFSVVSVFSYTALTGLGYPPLGQRVLIHCVFFLWFGLSYEPAWPVLCTQ